MKTSIPASILSAALVFAAAPQAADAFQVKTTRDHAQVHWDERFVMYHLNEAGSDDMTLAETRASVLRSFNAWNRPGSELRLVYGGETPQSDYGYNRNGENTNLIVWEEDEWAFDSSVLAVTLTTFNIKSGELLDADIVVNGTQYDWSADGSADRHDLSNSLTHEVGHFIGLDHSDEHEATMFASAPIGELQKRDLSEDDINGLAFIYGAGEDALVGGPENGFSEEQAEEYGVRLNDAQLHLNCSAIGGPTGGSKGVPGGLIAFGALLLGGVFVRRRRDVARVLALTVAVGSVSMAVAPERAEATTMKELTLTQLSFNSDRIVLAEVVDQEAAFESGVIWTTTTLRVEACPEGMACVEGEELQMRTPSGEVGEIAQAISGVRTMEVGQRAVFFLSLAGRLGTVYRPMGLAQGVLPVEQVGDTMMAHRDLVGLHLKRVDESVIDGDELTYGLPLDELFGQIDGLRASF